MTTTSTRPGTAQAGTTQGGIEERERTEYAPPGEPSAAPARRATTELVTERGRTSISDAVVRKIAGVATREVAGVHALGTGGGRAIQSMRARIPGASPSVGRGVAVEVGERQAAVDLDVVADYGVSIVDLARQIRGNVISSIEDMTGLEVTEVNIAVDDVYIGEEESGEPRARVE